MLAKRFTFSSKGPLSIIAMWCAIPKVYILSTLCLLCQRYVVCWLKGMYNMDTDSHEKLRLKHICIACCSAHSDINIMYSGVSVDRYGTVYATSAITVLMCRVCRR